MSFNNAYVQGSESQSANLNSITDMHPMMANILRTLEETNKEVKEIKKHFSQFKYENEIIHTRLLTEIKLLQNQDSIYPKVSGVLPNKPLETGDDFNKFEKTIQESSQKAMELAEELKTYVITDLSKFVRTILKKLLSNELASTFSWRGTKSKQAFKYLTTTAVIRGVCAEKFKMNEKEFEFTFARWFQTATDRLNYQKRTEKV